jgi:hypothetical protein
MMSLKLTIAAVALAGLLGPSAFAEEPGVEPGEWEIAVTVDAMDMQGAPGAVANLLVGKTATAHTCLTPEEARKGPKKLLESSKDCVFDHYSMENGRVSGEMVCLKGDHEMRVLTEGRYTPTSFRATGKAVVAGDDPMKMDSTSVGKRVGDCAE